MILATHILAGGAIGSKFSKKRWLPIFIILVLASHYLLDYIPHYEYSIYGLRNGINIDFIISSLRVAIDMAAGLLFLVFFCRQRQNFYYIIGGGLIAFLPDILIFLNWHLPNLRLLVYLVNFGTKIHFSENNPIGPGLRLTFEIITSGVAVLVLFLKKTKKLPDKKSKPGLVGLVD